MSARHILMVIASVMYQVSVLIASLWLHEHTALVAILACMALTYVDAALGVFAPFEDSRWSGTAAAFILAGSIILGAFAGLVIITHT